MSYRVSDNKTLSTLLFVSLLITFTVFSQKLNETLEVGGASVASKYSSLAVGQTDLNMQVADNGDAPYDLPIKGAWYDGFLELFYLS